MTLRAAVSLVDLQTSVTYARPAAEVAYVVLAAAMYEDTSGLFRFVPETVVMSDDTAFSLSKQVSDAFGLIDAPALSVSKPASDSVTLSDVVQTVLTFIRQFTESVALSEAQVLSVAKAIYDTQLVSDNQTRSTDKALADGFGLNEQFAFNYLLASTIDNVTFAGDQAALNVGKVFTDSTALTDSGYVISQDYCNLTYFAQDYVGTAVTF